MTQSLAKTSYCGGSATQSIARREAEDGDRRVEVHARRQREPQRAAERDQKIHRRLCAVSLRRTQMSRCVRDATTPQCWCRPPRRATAAHSSTMASIRVGHGACSAARTCARTPARSTSSNLEAVCRSGDDVQHRIALRELSATSSTRIGGGSIRRQTALDDGDREALRRSGARRQGQRGAARRWPPARSSPSRSSSTPNRPSCRPRAAVVNAVSASCSRRIRRRRRSIRKLRRAVVRRRRLGSPSQLALTVSASQNAGPCSQQLFDPLRGPR